MVENRTKAQALIMAGRVRVNGVVVTKAGTAIPEDADIHVDSPLPYVSRGGVKLAAALDIFSISPEGVTCADVGASTGGFTDVLLQAGAARVYAIDVGYGQLAWKLRQDQRVTVMERTNARYLERLPEPVGIVTIDASFISLGLILPVIGAWLTSPGKVIALIKPQFEAGKEQVGKGGVVRDQHVHRQVLRQVFRVSTDLGYMPAGLIPSPITGPAGNHEFLLHLDWQGDDPEINIEIAIERCLLAISK
jgi:23S rRNA (cytidine1920-2'-O)/16S rRNA (cytidine1409-2'-O)-methyltransferase